jgi:Domain of unknown function (DUF4124)
MKRPLVRALVASALWVSLAAQAAVIYRWVDERGRTHLSDVVPEKYQKSATRIDTGESAVSPERKRQADEAAARDKAFADEATKRRQSAQAAPPAAAASAAAPATPAKRPAQGVTDATDCATWWRLYRESEACFGPYRSVGGGTKPEAFEKCNPIPSPEPKCGPVRE